MDPILSEGNGACLCSSYLPLIAPIFNLFVPRVSASAVSSEAMIHIVPTSRTQLSLPFELLNTTYKRSTRKHGIWQPRGNDPSRQLV